MTLDDFIKSSSVRFGTSGVRGPENEMTDILCFAYTLGFLKYATYPSIDRDAIKKVAVAGDLRESTDRIVKGVFKAIEFLGLTPLDCGRIPTPTLALYGISEKIPAIMVTGSHIPDGRNGLKFYLPEGEILKSDESKIRTREIEIPEKMFDAKGMLLPEHFPKTVVSAEKDAKEKYIQRFETAIPKRVLEGIRFALYEHSSVASDLLTELYTRLGAKVTRLGRTDSFKALDTEAVSEDDLLLAKKWAASDPNHVSFDAIVSTDGDGDRPLLFDENGDWVRGDAIGIMVARLLNADCVVTPLNSNTGVERTGWFQKVIRTKIGSPYVVEAMNQAIKEGYQRVIGYEANGGILTASPILIDEDYAERPLSPLPTRDAAIGHIGAVAMAKLHGVPLSLLVHLLPRRVTMSDCIRNIPSDTSIKKLDELLHGGRDVLELVFAGFGELTEINTMDGLRMEFTDQDIVHLRPSGNAPEFRCYVESETKETARKLLQKTTAFVKEHFV